MKGKAADYHMLVRMIREIKVPRDRFVLFAKSYTSAKQGDDLATDSENTFVT